MKKLFLILVSVMMVAGCQTNFEKSARAQMVRTLKKHVNNSESMRINDVKVAFEADSAIVLHCNVEAKNDFGDLQKTRIEYIYIISKEFGDRRDCLINLDKKESVLKSWDSYKELPSSKPDNKYFRQDIDERMREGLFNLFEVVTIGGDIDGNEDAFWKL